MSGPGGFGAAAGGLAAAGGGAGAANPSAAQVPTNSILPLYKADKNDLKYAQLQMEPDGRLTAWFCAGLRDQDSKPRQLYLRETDQDGKIFFDPEVKLLKDMGKGLAEKVICRTLPTINEDWFQCLGITKENAYEQVALLTGANKYTWLPHNQISICMDELVAQAKALLPYTLGAPGSDRYPKTKEELKLFMTQQTTPYWTMGPCTVTQGASTKDLADDEAMLMMPAQMALHDRLVVQLPYSVSTAPDLKIYENYCAEAFFWSHSKGVERGLVKLAIESDAQHAVFTGNAGEQVVAPSPLTQRGDGTRVHESFADKLPKKRPHTSVGGPALPPQAPDPSTFVLPPLITGKQALGKRASRLS